MIAMAQKMLAVLGTRRHDTILKANISALSVTCSNPCVLHYGIVTVLSYLTVLHGTVFIPLTKSH